MWEYEQLSCLYAYPPLPRVPLITTEGRSVLEEGVSLAPVTKILRDTSTIRVIKCIRVGVTLCLVNYLF